MTTQLEERFDALADIWRKQTHYHSNTAIIMRHPAINTIIEMGQPAVPLILRRWRDHGGMWQHALSTITGVHITEGITDLTDANQEGIKGWVAISYPTLRAAWLKWGVENQHLETRPETPMLREMGYSLRRLSTHKWIVGTLCIHHDGEGDNNTSDAQRQKLGKLAFRPDF